MEKLTSMEDWSRKQEEYRRIAEEVIEVLKKHGLRRGQLGEVMAQVRTVLDEDPI